VCWSHGSHDKICNYPNCTNKARARGKCHRHDKEGRLKDDDGLDNTKAPVDQPTKKDDESAISEDAQAFVPSSSKGDNGRGDKVEEKDTSVEDDSPTNDVVSMVESGTSTNHATSQQTNQNNDSRYDSDEEEELSALLYRSSRMAKSMKKSHDQPHQMRPSTTPNNQIPPSSKGDNDSDKGKEGDSPANGVVRMVASGTSINYVASQQTNQNDYRYDSDEEEELGAHIYRSSRMTKSIEK